MTTIILNDIEKEIALHIAKARYFSNRKAGVKNKQLPALEYLQPDILGAESELAACKMLNIYPEGLFDVSPRSVKNGEDNGDIVYNNKVIDVKSTPHPNGRLLSTTKNNAVNVFILMTGKDGEYVCRGGTTAKELYKEERYGNNNGMFKIPCYYMLQSELVDYKKLLDIA